VTENKDENFLGLPELFSAEVSARFVVLPIPYELTTTYGKGTVNGPSAILKASQQVELYDEEIDMEPYKSGVYTAPRIDCDASPEEVLEKIYRTTVKVLSQGKIPIALGGEHTLTVGAVKAFSEAYDNLTVLQLDAHADLRDEYLGSKLNHACTARRLLEYVQVVQAGIRSMCGHQDNPTGRNEPKTFFAQEMKKKRMVDEVLSNLSENVYLTIDLDVFDTGIMPSVGTPEPGGLDWYEVLELIHPVTQHKTIVGFDAVELCPQPGNIAPDFLAAKLVYKVIGYMVSSNTERT
jgi:agmatinase